MNYCKLNNDNLYSVPPINDTILKCHTMQFKDNKINNKLNECKLKNTPNLLHKLPSTKTILKKLVNRRIELNAGKINNELNKNQIEINKRLKNDEINNITRDLTNTLDDSYKLVLAERVNNFNKYLIENDIDTQTENITEFKNQYIKMLKDINEKSKEFKLLKNYSICKSILLKNIAQ